MKKVAIILSFLSLCVFGQNQYSPYYHQRASLFEELPIMPNDVVFLGNSITDGAEWQELFPDVLIKNRGISGDVCQGVLDRLEPIVSGKPNKVFLLIGTNDLAHKVSNDSVVSGIKTIVKTIQQKSPKTKIYLQSILPVNDSFTKFKGHYARIHDIPLINAELKAWAPKVGITYIDLYKDFVIPNTHQLNPDFTNDGLHLLGKAYVHWAKLIKPYLNER
ncbi:sialate O-acetylesterase [Ornithobacterium rhinotracheale]|uniref:GDSL-type esterase/lipase family protein n=1 Tax=Ornithobacterium rhinotracheale TaxID=28251 RepID=UPI00129D1C19|nr:GDSL-type esterase/lipase family protein [Ornithobacterium rhinotracheale]MRI63581.1 sialate O-acetylesterase [Ornithobacterium rhinotracheale]MRJ11460.1 sialate O-acetylesterase [Ornithobacterium rhinotracheale]